MSSVEMRIKKSSTLFSLSEDPFQWPNLDSPIGELRFLGKEAAHNVCVQQGLSETDGLTVSNVRRSKLHPAYCYSSFSRGRHRWECSDFYGLGKPAALLDGLCELGSGPIIQQ